jgi:hypothetical protein
MTLLVVRITHAIMDQASHQCILSDHSPFTRLDVAGCPCLNGPIPIATAQALVFIGWLFTLIALGDCNFVQVPGGALSAALVALYPEIVNGLSQSDDKPLLGVGFYSFEKANNRCYWYLDKTADNPNILRVYVNDILGDSWSMSRAVASTTPALTFLLLLYLMSYSCSAQPRPFRYATGIALSVVLVILQGLTLSVRGSAWCSENECQFARASGFSVGAMVCFFLAGICFFFTSDYVNEKARGADLEKGVVTGNDEEEPAVDDEEGDRGRVFEIVMQREDDEVSEYGQEVSLDGSLYIEEPVHKVIPKSILRTSRRSKGHEF